MRCTPLAPAKVGAAHRVLALTANTNSVRSISYCIEKENNLQAKLISKLGVISNAQQHNTINVNSWILARPEQVMVGTYTFCSWGTMTVCGASQSRTCPNCFRSFVVINMPKSGTRKAEVSCLRQGPLLRPYSIELALPSATGAPNVVVKSGKSRRNS